MISGKKPAKFFDRGKGQNMDYANAARFLKSYNKIESQLKLLYHAKATQNFTDLVRRCTDLNLTIRRYENELIDYGKLRNAIVHRTAGGEVFIANPSDDVVENIEYIERQLCNPPRATDVFKVKKISTVFADKPLVTAVQAFGESEKKTLVVYDHGKMAGVINSYYLYAKIAECAEQGGDGNVPAGEHLAVDFDLYAVAQLVEEQGLLHFGQADFPGQAGVAQAGPR